MYVESKNNIKFKPYEHLYLADFVWVDVIKANISKHFV